MGRWRRRSGDDDFAERSAAVRDALRPAVRAALERFAAEFTLEEPEALLGVWAVGRDRDGVERLVLSAHADSVNFVLGAEKSLVSIDAPYDWERLADEVVRMIEEAFRGSECGRCA